MNNIQYKRACEITETIRKIKYELEIWQTTFNKAYKLAYRPDSSGTENYCSLLETNIDEELFQAFRIASINKLRLDILLLKQEFTKL